VTMTLPLWHPCATRGCLTFVPVRGEVCRWCEQAAEAVARQFAAAFGLGVLPVRGAAKAGHIATVNDLLATGRLMLTTPKTGAQPDDNAVRYAYALGALTENR